MENYFDKLMFLLTFGKKQTEENLRKAEYIRTYNGINFHVFDPKPEEINIEDIAHSLSMQCRFNGHTSQFYSVASHANIGSNLIDKEFEFEFLNHDNAEAFFSDIPTPAKRRMPEAKKLEHNITKVINEKYSLPYPMSKEVKEMDDLMFRMEWVYLMNGENVWKETFPMTKENFIKEISKPTEQVKKEFIEKFNSLYDNYLKNIEQFHFI